MPLEVSLEAEARKLWTEIQREPIDTKRRHYRLGQIVIEAQSSEGKSLRDFANKVGKGSATTLSRDSRLVSRFTLDDFLKDERSYSEIVKSLTESTQTTLAPTTEATEITEKKPHPLWAGNPNRRTLLLECLHRYIRDSEDHLAMRTAWELAKDGDEGIIGTLWNELTTCSNEETSDPLTLIAV